MRTIATALETITATLEENAVNGQGAEAYAAAMFLRKELAKQYAERNLSDLTLLTFLGTLPESKERETATGSLRRKMMTDTFTRYTDPVKGCVWVEVTQMDADCSTWAELHSIEPDPDAYLDLCQRIEEAAECGPSHITMRVMDPARIEIWEPRDRDRILEARENGENYHV